MARFSAVPEIPTEGIKDWETAVLTPIKENVELLVGFRGEAGGGSRAVTKGELTVNLAPAMTLQSITAQGTGFTISGDDVAGLEDYGKLIDDVTRLGNDVIALRDVVNLLIEQLEG